VTSITDKNLKRSALQEPNSQSLAKFLARFFVNRVPGLLGARRTGYNFSAQKIGEERNTWDTASDNVSKEHAQLGSFPRVRPKSNICRVRQLYCVQPWPWFSIINSRRRMLSADRRVVGRVRQLWKAVTLTDVRHLQPPRRLQHQQALLQMLLYQFRVTCNRSDSLSCCVSRLMDSSAKTAR